MTVFENIKQMNINELTDWLYKNDSIDYSPWLTWYNKTYCQNCETVTANVQYLMKTCECAWCEIHGRCKFFPKLDDGPDRKQMIKLWLESEYKND